jgi:GalNAc-alpha-(1->4)-GalNAc-alpha-(1->3)-diNAcBac-PP-undecaprenol alpha-1,4-N-acetyl-D-galactosaminyltransferase
MKKICLVIPSLQAGGMERVMSELAEYFSRKPGIELHLILYGITREIFYPVPKKIFIHKPAFRFDNKWRLIYTIKTLIYLRRTVKSIHPATILSFGEYWNNFVLLSLFGLKYHVFVSDRNQPNKSLGLFQDNLRIFLYRRAKGLIFQTEKAKELYLLKSSHNNITVIGNPIKIDGRPKNVARGKNVLMVGRLIKSKHQDKLIEMFAKIHNQDWNLIIVGYDHLKQQHMERLKDLTKRLKIDKQVIFMGKVENVENIYGKCSIFAFTSSSEGFPNVIGEAMAAGLPVIAYDCVAGPSEMIKDGYNGFLIPLFDNSKFVSKLSILMENEAMRNELGSKARESIKQFSSDNICEKFYKFILS